MMTGPVNNGSKPDDSSNLTAALHYVGLGWWVFPIWPVLQDETGKLICECGNRAADHSVGKHPIHSGGDAGRWGSTNDPAKIREYWGLYPHAGIGVDTEPSGLVVVDCDVTSDDDGMVVGATELTNWAVVRGVRFPKTLTAETPSGGRHLVYEAGEHRIRSGTWSTMDRSGPTGVDLKASGGMFVVSPSLHRSGGRYRWVDDLLIEPTPLEEAVARLMPKKGETSSSSRAAGPLPEKIRHPGRHAALMSLGGSLARRGLTADEIFPSLWEFNLNRCEPPHSEAKVRSNAEDAAKYPAGDPIIGNDIGEAVEREKHRIRVQREARRQLDSADMPPLVDGVGLVDLLGEPEQETPWRVHDLWPAQGRVVLAAARKAGKTTTVGNLVRSLADGARFLDRFACEAPEGRVGLLDTEMSRDMLRSWLRGQGLARPDRVQVWPLRGQVGALNLLDRGRRAEWATRLRDEGVTVLVLDCLAPLLSALDLDEDNRGIGAVLGAWDELTVEAGVTESLVVHHMGHGPERSRGGSRLRDWPEVEWRLLRTRDEVTDVEEDGGQRAFAAYGRDVEVEETVLEYDPDTRRLRLGSGNRKAARQLVKLRGLLQAVQAMEAEGRHPTGNDVVKQVRRAKDTVLNELREAAEAGYLNVDKVGQAHVHSVTPLGQAFLSGEDWFRTGSEPVEPVGGSPLYRGTTEPVALRVVSGE